MVMRIGGLASGMDTDSIIKQLVAAQRIPVDRLLQQRQTMEWQRDAYREMNSKLMDFRNNKLSEFRLQSTFIAQKVSVIGDSEAVSAKISGSASVDSLTVKVDSLATAAAKWSSSDIRHATDKSLDPFEPIGNQQSKLDGSTFSKTNYTIKINGTEIKINKNTDSLSDIMVQINQKTNVTALYDEASGKISFRAEETGLVNGATQDQDHISFVDDGNFLKDILNIDVTDTSTATAGASANVTINGMPTTRSNNTFNVNGIEITLLKPTGNESTLRVANDTDEVVDTIKNFIESYNEMLSSLQGKMDESKYRNFPPLTEEQKKEMSEKEIELWEAKAKSGMLKNDSILSKAISDMRLSVASQVSTGDDLYKTLSSIGITTGAYNEKGKLYLSSETKLRAAIEANPEAIVEMFTSTGDINGSGMGVAERMYSDLKVSMDRINQKAGSSVALTDNSFMAKDIKRVNTSIDAMNRRLSDAEARFYRQFSAMETAINRFNMQSAYLANAFGGGQQ